MKNHCHAFTFHITFKIHCTDYKIYVTAYRTVTWQNINIIANLYVRTKVKYVSCKLKQYVRHYEYKSSFTNTSDQVYSYPIIIIICRLA